MKILLISNALGGGAGKACLRLFYALRRNGQEVKLLHLEGQSVPDPDIVSFYPSVRDLFLRQITSYPFQLVKHIYYADFHRAYRLPSSIHRLEKHPLIEWADVINLHWVPDFVHYRRFFKRIGRKPVVWTMHDMLPFSGGYHYESESPSRRIPRVERKIVATKRKATEGTNLTITAPSSWLLEVSERASTFANCRHTHIFNGLPLDIYKPTRKNIARSIMGLPGNKQIILFAADSVNSRRKGGHYLTAALDQLDQAGIVVVSVGRGRVEFGSGINHIPLGGVSDDVAMALCYSCADIVVTPSVEDNSPNIIIESLACGRPVVAFDIGGIGELVRSPDLGVLVEKVDASSLASGIRSALRTKFDTDAIRDSASSRFGYDSLADRYSALFAQLAPV